MLYNHKYFAFSKNSIKSFFFVNFIVIIYNIQEVELQSLENRAAFSSRTANAPPSNGSLTSIANIPDAIIALDNLRSSLNDVLEVFKVVTNPNSSNVNPFEEGDVPLSINDVRDTEHNGDNPLDPVNIDEDEVFPKLIEVDKTAPRNLDIEKELSERIIPNEVCGKNLRLSL